MGRGGWERSEEQTAWRSPRPRARLRGITRSVCARPGTDPGRRPRPAPGKPAGLLRPLLTAHRSTRAHSREKSRLCFFGPLVFLHHFSASACRSVSPSAVRLPSSPCRGSSAQAHPGSTPLPLPEHWAPSDTHLDEAGSRHATTAPWAPLPSGSR